MRTLTRGFIQFLFIIMVLSIPVIASAQQSCFECDPYGSCSEPCWYCEVLHPDGWCETWAVVNTTCGEYFGACNPDNCTPNWQETAREVRGTYGEASFFCWWGSGCTYSCTHHSVELVTWTDANQCNTSSYYWTQSSCQDYVDGWKGPSSHYEDCCSGFNDNFQLDPTYTCNHYHSCW